MALGLARGFEAEPKVDLDDFLRQRGGRVMAIGVRA
jgi:hypothetical protein